jgi:hypothetical protein
LTLQPVTDAVKVKVNQQNIRPNTKIEEQVSDDANE